MQSREELRRILAEIDGRGYKAYKALKEFLGHNT